MNPHQVDFAVDIAYGAMIFVSVVLIVFVGTGVGIAFGFGVLVSYVIHVAWKMARYDPEWMTREVTASIEETLTHEVDEIIDRLEHVEDRIDRRPPRSEVETRLGELSEGPPTGSDEVDDSLHDHR